jgi:hypothetical protein
MANFKVGQRVKKVRYLMPEDRVALDPSPVPLGAEGTVMNGPAILGCIRIRYDRYKSAHPSGTYSDHAYQLAPLTDPGADAFVERIKNLKPYEEPQIDRVRREFIEKIESVIGPLGDEFHSENQ